MELVYIPYSPWSERAVWSLDYAGLRYERSAYIPTVSEPALRVRLRQPTGIVSVPILFTEDRVIRGSDAIGAYVGERLSGFVSGDAQAIRTVADRAMASGRVLAGRRVLASPSALLGSVPPKLRALGPVAKKAASTAWQRILEKYDPESRSVEWHRRAIDEALTELDAAVGKGPYVGEHFSFADIVVASAVDFVVPHAGIALEPEVIAAWTDPELASRFSALVGWRDTLRKQRRHSAG